ncbi:MAG: O-antigen ligase family protein [Chloroflexota bacterium]
MTITAKQTETLSFPQVVLEIGWLLIAALIPLWINLWGSQPFDPAKISLFRWLVWLMGAVWLGTILGNRLSVNGKPFAANRSPLTGNRLPVTMPLLALTLVAVLSTITAVNPGLSFLGSQERAYGLLTLLSYLLLALIVATRLHTSGQARLLLGTMVVTAVPLLLLGGLQAAGQDPLNLVTDARSPIYATLGRANFVGAYLAMLLPLTLALALSTSNRFAQTGLVLLALGQLALIGLTLARAAWLAAGVGLLVLLLGWAWSRLSQASRHRLVAGLGLFLTSSGLLALRGLLLADAGSIAARRTIWQATLSLIGERPFLGHGLDSLASQFLRVFPPQLVYYQGRQVFVDRAHNWLLDTAVTIGLLGLLVTVWLWLVVFWWGWQALRQAQKRGDRGRWLLLLGCLAALASNLTGNLFSFDVAPTAVASWLLLGVVAALGQEQSYCIVRSAYSPTATQYAIPTTLTKWVAALLIVAALAMGWWGNGRFLTADIAQQRSIQAARQGNLTEALTAAQQAVTHWPQEPAYWQQLAQVYGAQGERMAAHEAWQQALTLRPNDPTIWTAKGQFYTDAVRQGWPDAWPQAEAAYAQAAALSPNTARIYVAWGRLALLVGRWETAVVHLERAVDLDTTDALAWTFLAEAYDAQGQADLAAAAWREAERWWGEGE